MSSLYAVDMKKFKKADIFWLRKNITKLMVADFNKNGVWDLEDCKTVAEKIIKIGNLKGAKAEEVYTFYRESAPPYFHTATNTTESLIGDINFRNDPNSRPIVYEYFAKWFRVLDLDGDGVIDQKEFNVFWDAYDLDPNYMKRQFDYIDEDKDGIISCQEFVDAGFDYYYSTKENDNLFYGLIQHFQVI